MHWLLVARRLDGLSWAQFMMIPEDRGTYILLASVIRMVRMEVGRLGEFDLVPGCYAYVGSALGHGGLNARIQHHLDSIAQPHWHIDYLLQFATPTEVWFAISTRKLEQDWADLLHDSSVFSAPIPRFGSSDYRRSRTSHLFYAKRKPSFRWFEQRIAHTYEPGLEVQQSILNGAGDARRLS